MDRVEVKKEARKIIETNKWNVWKPILVVMLISFIVTLIALIIGEICGANREIISSICESVLGFALLPVSVGMYAYYLKLIRGKEFSLEDLKAYYPAFFKFLVLDLLVALFTVLWSLLFIIPGIIAAISYSMVLYICVDKEELEALDTITESKNMMKGYKMDYFIFKLSFIGWLILVPFTFGILAIWLVPYMTIADAVWYDKLAKKYNSKKEK